MPVAGQVGLIVNPIAGTGGRVGLHGTDGEHRLREALRRGGAPASTPRTARTLRELAVDADLRVLTVPGVMGADLARASGVATREIRLDLPADGRTTAAHTREAARLLAGEGVDLLIFAGGDGTARDIAEVVGTSQPLLGIPCGVKMRSGVFATSPEAAAEVASAFLRGEARRCVHAEILDATPEGETSTEFYALASVPDSRAGMLAGPKRSSLTGSAVELDALCSAVAADLVPGVLYLFGPGTTTLGVMRQLGISGTPMGVDAVQDGRLVGADLAEDAILDLMDGAAVVRLILGVIGGQGFLLGRGNQQLGPAVLARIGADDLIIISSVAKLAALQPAVLLVDCGDETAFHWASGYRRVRVGPARFMMMRVAAAVGGHRDPTRDAGSTAK